MKRIIVLLLLLLFINGCSKDEKQAATEGKMLREGAVAPDFTVVDLSGQKATLSSLRGKVVFLNFWATWCPPCREEMPSMIRLNKAMEGTQFQMMAVSIDDGGAADVQAFIKKTGYSLPAYVDPGQGVSKIYGITGVPETFVIDRNGVIVKKVVGGMDWSSPDVVSYLKVLAAK